MVQFSNRYGRAENSLIEFLWFDTVGDSTWTRHKRHRRCFHFINYFFSFFFLFVGVVVVDYFDFIVYLVFFSLFFFLCSNHRAMGWHVRELFAWAALCTALIFQYTHAKYENQKWCLSMQKIFSTNISHRYDGKYHLTIPPSLPPRSMSQNAGWPSCCWSAIQSRFPVSVYRS